MILSDLLLTTPKVTLLYCGLLALFYAALTIYVIRWRWKERRGLGHDDNPASGLFRAVRIHAHFFEFVPFTLLLIALDEMTGRNKTFIHALGATLVVARVLHFWGIKVSDKVSPQRTISVLLTIGLLVVLGIALLQKGL